MRNTSLTVALLIVLGTTQAQLVIDGSGFTQEGSVLNYESASPDWLINQNVINIDGQEATWNIEDWESITDNTESYFGLDGFGQIEQIFFNNPNLNPYTLSTHALSVGADVVDLPLPIEISNGFTYFRNDETGYYNTGLSFEVSGFPLVTQNDTVERIYKFPLHYADTDSSTLHYLTSLPTIGAYGQYAKRYTLVDGEGTLVTPTGTYDVLRLKAERLITDTLFIEQLGGGQTIERPLQTDYIWISPDFEGPLLEMSVVQDVVISARFLAGQNPVGLFSSKPGDVKVYPNPARDFIRVEGFSSQSTIRLYDLSGKLLFQQMLNTSRVDIEKLNPGIYLLEISRIQGEYGVQKLVITE